MKLSLDKRASRPYYLIRRQEHPRLPYRLPRRLALNRINCYNGNSSAANDLGANVFLLSATQPAASAMRRSRIGLPPFHWRRINGWSMCRSEN